MKKWLNSFWNIPSEGDERVISVANSSHSLAGQVVGFLLFGYVMINLFMQTPSEEYDFCLLLFFLYMIISKVNNVKSGVGEETKSIKGWKDGISTIVVVALMLGFFVYRDVATGESFSELWPIAFFTAFTLIIGYVMYYRILDGMKPSDSESESEEE